MENDIKDLKESVETIAKTTAMILENMVTKNEFQSFRLETITHFNNLEGELKSFKNETKENLKDLNEKFDDLSDTVMNHDKRIEILEEKVLA